MSLNLDMESAGPLDGHIATRVAKSLRNQLPREFMENETHQDRICFFDFCAEDTLDVRQNENTSALGQTWREVTRPKPSIA
jgi:hypothetical protein